VDTATVRPGQLELRLRNDEVFGNPEHVIAEFFGPRGHDPLIGTGDGELPWLRQRLQLHGVRDPDPNFMTLIIPPRHRTREPNTRGASERTVASGVQ
jgi:hypothetical protein